MPEIYGEFRARRIDASGGVIMGASGAHKLAIESDSTAIAIDVQTGVYIETALLSTSANKYNSIYGDTTTVQPPALTINYIIKL